MAAIAAVVAPLTAHATRSAPATPLQLAAQTASRLGTTLSTANDAPLASNNVSLVTTVPGTFAGLRIVGKHAYATGWDGLTAFDISHPAHPVQTGFLPLPHFENEDVDSDGNIALVSNDRESKSKGGFLYVIDVSDPSALQPLAVLSLNDLGSDLRGPGHIANCVGGTSGCQWAWLTGGRKVWVVDLRDPANPKLVRGFDTPVSTGSTDFGGKGTKFAGATHDVERDEAGRLWVTGSGGMAVYDATDPAHPTMLAYTGKSGLDPKNNQFILHNSVHPAAASYHPHASSALQDGDVLLMTEENYTDTNTDDSEAAPGGCREQGRFETWDVHNYSRGRTPTVIDKWTSEVSGTPYLSGTNNAPLTVFCSSHWFRERNGWVADGWYEQGTRLLDVRDPAHIRQVGYWVPPNAVTWAAYWVTDEIVYTADIGRGLDVLRVGHGGAGSDAPTVVAPIRSSWLGAAPNFANALVKESRQWHWACASQVHWN